MDVKREVALANRILWATGLSAGITAALGHASMRIPEQPVYPHTRVVVTDDEGAEVARLMAGWKAVLLQGHGATTTGASLQESVMNMLQLEEQARMNYYALSALGPDYPSLPAALVDEVVHAPSHADLDHFREPFARAQGQPPINGVWQYYAAQVAEQP